jgi:hypothetical protein
MNVEIGTEAAQFPDKEYINGIAVAVYVVIAISHAVQVKTYWRTNTQKGDISTEFLFLLVYSCILVHSVNS